jgi:ribonuclease HI
MADGQVRRQQAVDVFPAGVCDGNRGPGGWGVVLQYGSRSREVHGAELAPTSSDRMLLTAVAEALDRLTRPVAVHVHADQAIVGRHRDLRSRLTTAAQRHQVRWVGEAASGGGAERAGALARTGLLEATHQLDSRCVHDLIIRQCWQCRPSASMRPERVAVTSGGAVFHLSEDCTALNDGWRRIERRGGVRSDLTWVPTVDAITAGRGACEICCVGHDVR